MPTAKKHTNKKSGEVFKVPPISTPSLSEKIENNFYRLENRLIQLERYQRERESEDQFNDQLEVYLRRERKKTIKYYWIGILLGLGYGVYATYTIMRKSSKAAPGIISGSRKS